jgi:hypothetical protein
MRKWMKQFTVRGDFHLGELTAVFDIPSFTLDGIGPCAWMKQSLDGVFLL